MRTSLRSLAIAAFMAGAGHLTHGQGCLNTAQYPSGSFQPPADGSVLTVSTCVFFQEYTHFTGITAGASYEFTINGGGFITLREGAANGPVVGTGVGALVHTATSGADLFAHYNVNAACATSTTCQINTVQLLLNCVPPTVTYAVEADCDLFEYTVNVTIVSLGDAGTVDISTNIPGIDGVQGVTEGTYPIGPFANLDGVVITVAHDTDPLCNRVSPPLQAPVCPEPIFCGEAPGGYDFCYGPNENRAWSYYAEGSGTLRLTFIQGTIAAFAGDQLRIYDGPDNTSPLVFQHGNFTTMNLGPVGSAVNNTLPGYYGIEVYSTSGAIYMEMTSDGFTHCSNTPTFDTWLWEVVCLDCEVPQATVTVVDDCPNNQFSLEVDVASVGDGGVVNFLYTVNGGGQQVVADAGVGVTVLGPFLVNDVVVVTMEHGNNPLCNIALGSFTDSDQCPNLIFCGQPALEETYCYGPNEARDWYYEAVGSGTLRLRFLRGTIESATWDRVRIYDGPDNTAPLLFAHTATATFNLGPVGSAVNNAIANYHAVEVYSTSGALYMELVSDGVIHCTSSTTYDPWEWEVVCLDCTIPQGTLSREEDCDAGTFNVLVDVTSTGDGATVDIEYTVDGGAPQTVAGVGTGITTLGPFAFDQVINVQLRHESNGLCDISLGSITDSGTCPDIVVCGTPLNTVFCHGNNIDQRFYFQGSGAFPLAMLVNTGTIEVCCDRFFVYDGADITAPQLTPPGGAVGNLAGLLFISTNPENRLTVRVTTDVSVSCQSGSNIQLDWTIDCLDCVQPQASFAVVQDCANEQYFVAVDVTSLGSDPELEITNNAGAPAIAITAPGTYQVGPIPSGTPVQVTLVNSDNSLCNIASATLVNPICPEVLCGEDVLEETYCYGPNENRAWAYELPGSTGNLRLVFQRGTIESNTWDRLNIYDGPDANGTLLFTHNSGLTSNLGPVGSAVNNTLTNFYAVDVTSTTGNLYMTLTSDPSIHCTSSTTYDPWEWTVFCEGCEAPGITYNMTANCFDRTYKVEVIVTEVGSSGVTIEHLESGQVQSATQVGVVPFGPYALNAPSTFKVTDLDTQCPYTSETMTFPSDSCVIRTCGFDNYEYCYENNEDRWYTFQSEQNVPMTIGFLEGQMLAGDFIVIYNGFNENAAVLYQGNNNGNFTGFAVNSQNPNNAITLRIRSNASGSCETGEATIPLRWFVACGAVGIDEAGMSGFRVFPNPTNGTLFVDMGAENLQGALLRMFDMSGRVVLEQGMDNRSALASVDVSGLASGQYMVQLVLVDRVLNTRVQVGR